MVQHREAAEPRFDTFLIGVEGYCEEGVEVGCGGEGVVGFVDRVQEVQSDDENVCAFVVASVAGLARLWGRVTSARH